MKYLASLVFSILAFSGFSIYLDMLESPVAATPVMFVLLGICVLLLPITQIVMWNREKEIKITLKNYFIYFGLDISLLVFIGGYILTVSRA